MRGVSEPHKTRRPSARLSQGKLLTQSELPLYPSGIVDSNLGRGRFHSFCRLAKK
jgi:hypothetical protein